MDAKELLERLERVGVRAETSGDTLRLTPGSRVPSDLVELVRWHKAEIIAALRGETLPSPSEVADGVEACLRLGARLKIGTISYIVCGLTGRRCTGCQGIPCLGSQAP